MSGRWDRMSEPKLSEVATELDIFNGRVRRTNPFLSDCLDNLWSDEEAMEKHCISLGNIDDAGKSVDKCLDGQRNALLGAALTGNNTFLETPGLINDLKRKGRIEGYRACDLFLKYEANLSKPEAKRVKRTCRRAVNNTLADLSSCLNHKKRAVSR